MMKYGTIEALAEAIDVHVPNMGTVKELSRFLELYDGNDWESYSKFDAESYQRVQLIQKPVYEIRLLCWSGLQSSAVHDHPERGCAMKVLQGELVEELYSTEPVACVSSHTLKTNQCAYIDNSLGVHRVKNNRKAQAVSLHIYSPPNYNYKTYELA